jgi:hypothetical protein
MEISRRKIGGTQMVLLHVRKRTSRPQRNHICSRTGDKIIVDIFRNIKNRGPFLMRKMWMFFSLAFFVASVLVQAPRSAGQDEPSLGDAARQARLQKQQKEAQDKGAANQDLVRQDPARQAGDKKDERKNAGGKTDQAAVPTKKTPKVITNEELSEHVGSVTQPSVSQASYRRGGAGDDGGSAAANSPAQAEALKSQITAMKNNVAALQSQIDSLNSSIQFAPGNCVANCVQWNERQVQKQQQVEQMKAQLEDQKKQLEDAQETARKQGFGSSVYDP